MNDRVRYLVMSDVHLGHPKNPTRKIVNNIVEYFDGFSDKSPFASINIIFIAGDLLDRLVDAERDDLYEIIGLLGLMINFCKRHRIKLRILEGTPSHDRRQSRLVETLVALTKTDADVKWVSSLCIERMDDLNLSILYVPDEYSPTTQITQELVRGLLKENDLEQVDIAIMHGMFAYQMAGIPGRHDTHDEAFYLSVVKHFINIGHIHTHSIFQRIIAQGSFDRIAQGEEEAKGAVLVTIRSDRGDYFEFIQNTGAMVFKTVTLNDMDLEKSIDAIDFQVRKVPDDSHIRIRAPKLHPVFMVFAELRRRYPMLNLSKLSIEDEEVVEKAKPIENSYAVVEIRPENVIPLIMGEIPNLPEDDSKTLQNMLTNLQSA